MCVSAEHAHSVEEAAAVLKMLSSLLRAVVIDMGAVYFIVSVLILLIRIIRADLKVLSDQCQQEDHL